MTDPAFQEFDGTAPKQRARPIHPESALQKGVYRAVKRAVACEFEFACHDRGAEHNTGSHIWEAQRGYRAAWPDAEIALAGGRTFRCELKRPGWAPPRPGLLSAAHWEAQERMIARLNQLGHPAHWASSVRQFLEVAERAGVPLRQNWRTVADHEDALVAADIRKQEARRDAGPSTKARKPMRKKVSPGRIRRLEGVRGRVLF